MQEGATTSGQSSRAGGAGSTMAHQAEIVRQLLDHARRVVDVADARGDPHLDDVGLQLAHDEAAQVGR